MPLYVLCKIICMLMNSATSLCEKTFRLNVASLVEFSLCRVLEIKKNISTLIKRKSSICLYRLLIITQQQHKQAFRLLSETKAVPTLNPNSAKSQPQQPDCLWWPCNKALQPAGKCGWMKETTKKWRENKKLSAHEQAELRR